MPRRRPSDREPVLSGHDLSGRPITAAGLVEYDFLGERWRCARFQELAAEFPVLTETGKSRDPQTWTSALPEFHAAAMAKPRAWMFVRRLFGIRPMLPPSDALEEDLKVWSREELLAAQGITRAQLQQDLEALRGHVAGVMKESQSTSNIEHRTTNSEREKGEREAAAKGELHFPEEELLRKHGFAGLDLKRVEDRAWFAQRVEAFDKVLSEPMASGLARRILMVEFDILNLDRFIKDETQCKPGMETWRANVSLRDKLDGTYRGLLEQLEKMCPWATQIGGKHSLLGVLSDITRAIQLHAQGDDTLVDGIFTMLEIQVLCRQSVQRPEPQYLAGHVMYLNMAKAGLMDPNWKPPAGAQKLVKRLNAAFREAFMALGVRDGEALPDLEKAGPEGEYAVLSGHDK